MQKKVKLTEMVPMMESAIGKYSFIGVFKKWFGSQRDHNPPKPALPIYQERRVFSWGVAHLKPVVDGGRFCRDHGQ